jgi:hypothetical protein
MQQSTHLIPLNELVRREIPNNHDDTFASRLVHALWNPPLGNEMGLIVDSPTSFCINIFLYMGFFGQMPAMISDFLDMCYWVGFDAPFMARDPVYGGSWMRYRLMYGRLPCPPYDHLVSQHDNNPHDYNYMGIYHAAIDEIQTGIESN